MRTLFLRAAIPFLTFLATGAEAFPRPSFIRLENEAAIRDDYRLTDFDPEPVKKKAKVLVIASGFSSLHPRVAEELVFFPNTYRWAGEKREVAVTGGDEGTALAAVVSALTGYQPERLELWLAPVDSPEQLVAALGAIEEPIDAVVGGGVFPTLGESSPEVRQAIQGFLARTGAVWFQAAGEEARRVVVADGKGIDSGWVKLQPRGFPQEAIFIEGQSALGFLPGEVTLTWHARTDASSETVKDRGYRLCLYRNSVSAQAEPESCSPKLSGGRITLRLKLDKNDGRPYHFLVQPAKPDQTVSDTVFRFHFQPLAERQARDANGDLSPPFLWKNETLFQLPSPADVEGVIVTKGMNRDSSAGPALRGGPFTPLVMDLWEVSFADGRPPVSGSAVAVAMAAGIFAHLHSSHPELRSAEQFLSFRAYWPLTLMQREGWSLNEEMLTALVKAHPGVVKYLAPRVKDGWVGVRQRGNPPVFSIATTKPPKQLASFKEKAGEKNLYFISAPGWDVTGQSVETAVMPDPGQIKTGVVVIPSTIKVERSVQLEDFSEVLDRPAYWVTPLPAMLRDYLATGQLPPHALRASMPFPPEILARIPKPAPAPLPKKLPEPVAQPTPRYHTVPLYAENGSKFQKTGIIDYQDGNGTWQRYTITVGPRSTKYIGLAATGTEYTWTWKQTGYSEKLPIRGGYGKHTIDMRAGTPD